MADVDESDSKPKILVIGGSKSVTQKLNHSERLSFSFSNVFSDFKECYSRILFYPAGILSREACAFEKAMTSFENDVSSLGGIEGAVLYIWVDRSDFKLKEEIAKRLRLEERECVWEFGAGLAEILPKMDQFFEVNAQTLLKPAKRDNS